MKDSITLSLESKEALDESDLEKIRAGSWLSSVPESLVLEGRYGIGVGDDIEEARRVFEKTLSETMEADP